LKTETRAVARARRQSKFDLDKSLLLCLPAIRKPTARFQIEGIAVLNDLLLELTPTAAPKDAPADIPDTQHEGATYHDREWWARERQARPDIGTWDSIIELHLWWIDHLTKSACRFADAESRWQPKPKPRPRPTPQVVIEAVMWSVRERGIAALREPENR